MKYLIYTAILCFFSTQILGQSQEVQFCMSTTEYGNETVLDVKVFGFEDIISFQFGLSWLSENYEMTKIENVNSEFPKFDETSFGPAKAIEGKTQMIRTSWNDNPPSPMSLEDGSTLFSARFKNQGNVKAGNFEIRGHKFFQIEVVNKKYDILSVKVSHDNCQEEEIVSHSETANNVPLEINLHPNPSYNSSEVQFNQQVKGNLQILALDGSLLWEQEMDKVSAFKLDLSQYEPGAFYVKFLGSEEKSITKKLIKVR